jgi:hypothetical protein
VVWKQFSKFTDPFTIDLVSDEAGLDKIEGSDEGADKREKYHVPENLDEPTLAVIQSVLKDKNVIKFTPAI